ncbi:MAG: hypothetical protein H0T46_29205 [Deltaproteobacteria bacterium]|nr:hypothetical protein [Deltaproteobacteria bacterium]
MAQPADPTAPPPPVAPAPAEPPVPPTPPTPPEAPVVVIAPEPKPAEKEKKPNAGFDGGFFIRSDDGKYSLKITGRAQPYLNITRNSAANPGDPDDRIVDWRSNFEVRRARLVFDGKLHGKNLTYKLQTDFGKGVVSVRDIHFDVRLEKDVWVRVGQWKRPFSRQQITSSGRQELSDRSITDRAFGAGRDVGIAIRNDYEKSPDLEWIVGVFNGRGEAPVLAGTVTTDPMTGMGTIGTTSNTNVPTKFRPAIVGRVGINRNGLKGYTEADLEGGPMRFGVGLSAWLEGDFDDDKKSNQKLQADYIVKAQGFSTTGGVYAMTDQEAIADTSITDAETSLVGFHAQAGYMLNKNWQGAARYSYVNDPRQKAKTVRDQQEIAVTASYYGVGHDAKFQAGVRLVKTGDADFTDIILFEIGSNVGW